jgi:hypothetical protein
MLGARLNLSLVLPIGASLSDAHTKGRQALCGAATRRADHFLTRRKLQPKELRLDPDIRRYGKYRPDLEKGCDETVTQAIQFASYQNEIGNLRDAKAIALRAKDRIAGLDTSFGHRCALKCDCVIRDAGQPITGANPELWQRAARTLVKRCLAVGEFPAAIAALGSEAVILRDRAFLEQDHFETYLREALDLIAGMRDLLVGKCSGRGFDRQVILHVEHQLLFLKARFSGDLGEQLDGREILRFQELDGELHDPRIRLDTLRGLATQRVLQEKFDEAAEMLIAATWLYEHETDRRSPYTFFSLLKSMCSWSVGAHRRLPMQELLELYDQQFVRYPQAAIELRFRRFVPRWPATRSGRILRTAPRFATRMSNLWNHPKLLAF